MKPHLLTTFIALLLLASSVHAQYPRVSKAVAEEAAARRAAANNLSDEAFAKAQTAMREWAAKGKPFRPGAARRHHPPHVVPPGRDVGR